MSRNDPELHNSVSAGAYISNDSGGLLLLLNPQDLKWGPPSGRTLRLETPPEAAIRETKEESNLDILLTGLIGIYPFPKDEFNTGYGFAFRAKITGGNLSLKSDEAVEARYFSQQEIRALIDAGKIRHPRYNLPAIQDFFDGVSFPLEVIRR